MTTTNTTPNSADTAGRYKVQKRDQQGRYDFAGDWDRLCVCGHTLGVHAGASPSDCLLYSFAAHTKERTDHAHQPDAKCGCEKFRPKKSKGKFVYLDRASLTQSGDA